MAKGRLTRQGSPHAQQLRIVCGDCNQEWMSRVQNDAKTSLTRLMRDDWRDLTLVEAGKIATWVAMVTMCLEFADLRTQAVPPEERRALMETGEPPTNWLIGIGRCDNQNAPGTFWHRAAQFDFSFQADQTTTTCLERCFAHALSGLSSRLPVATEYFVSLGIRQFWPLPDQAPSPPLVFTPAGMTRVSMKYWEDNGLNEGLLLGHKNPFVPRS